MRSGILAAGNWIRDHVKTIDAWPAEDGLANIVGRADGNGGKHQRQAGLVRTFIIHYLPWQARS